MPLSVVEGNPYDDLVGKWTGAAGLAAHSDSTANPDEAASALSTSKQIGIPPEVTGLDPAAFAAELKAKRNADLVKGSPALTNYVNTVPLASKVSNDDFENLDALHKKLLQIERAGTALSEQRSGFGAVGSSILKPGEFARGFELGTGSEQLGFSAGTSHDIGFGKGSTAAIRNQLNMLENQGGTDVTSRIARAAGSGVGGLVTDFLTGGVPGFFTGGPAGAVIGTSIASGLAAYGRHLDELDQEEQKTGVKIPEVAKQLGAGVVGAATGALNSIGLGGPAANVVKTAVRQGVMDALPHMALDLGKAAALGAGINGVLQDTHDIVIDATKKLSGSEEPTIFDSAEKQAELRSNIAKAMVEGAAYMGAFHVFGVGSNAIADGIAIRRADQAAAQHKAAMDAADATETKGRSPEALRQFIEIAKRDKTVSIPAAKIDELNMADTLRPLVSNFDEQMNLGRESGGDVTIPYSAYLSGVEGSVDATLAKDLRHDPEGLTQNEAAELKDQIAALPSMKEPVGETTPILEPPSEPAAFSKQVSDTAAKELYLNPLFPKPEDVGMTKEQFDRYSRLIEQRHTAENKAALDAQTREVARRESIEWKNNEQHLREELSVELDRSPEWAAHDFTTKRMLGGKEIPDNVPTKLDRAAVERLTSEPLPRGTTVARKGVDPEEVADLLGFRSGKELVDALAGLERDRGDRSMGQHRKAVVEDAVQARMEAQFGKFDENVEAEARATAYQHNVQEVLHMEMQTLGKEIGAPPFKLDALRDFAKEQIGRKTVKEARQLKAFNRMAGTEGRRAEMALLKGKRDPVAAFKAKQKQLVAHLLASEAERFDREATKAVKRFSRLAKKKTSEAIDQSYLNQIHGLLFKYGVKVNRNPSELSQTLAKQTLAEFVKTKEAELGPNQLMISPDLYSGLPTESFKNVSVERFRELSDAIKSLEKHGRNEKTIMLRGERVLLDNVIDQVAANLEALKRRWPDGKKRGARENTKNVVKTFDSYLIRFEDFIDDLDRLDPNGILNQVYRETLVKGKHKEYDLLNEAGRRLKEISKDSKQSALENEIIDSKLFRDRRSPMRPPLELSRMDWRIIGLNLGNKGNAEKLARGYNVTVSEMRAEANRILNEEDWKWVNKMWDFFRWLWPMIEDKAIRTTGVPPDPSKPTPFVTRFGKANGGHFPLMYDPHMGGKVLAESAKRHGLFDPNYKSSTPDKGYMQSRVEKYTNFVHIQGLGSRLPTEIRSIIHDLAMHEALVDIRKLLMNERIVDAIQRSRGPEYAEMIDPFLRDQANHYNTEDQQLHLLTKMSRTFRQNFTTAVLGFNLKTIFTPNTGHLGRVLGLLGGRPLDTINAIMNSKTATKFAYDNSPELQHWIEDKNREVNELYGQMIGMKSLRFEAARAAIITSTMIERRIATIEWHAEYQAAKRAGHDDDTAFALADKAIRMNYGRGGTLDQPKIMRALGEQGRWLTLFYGFGNLMYNRTRRVVKLGERGIESVRRDDWAGARRDFAAALGQTLSFVIVPALFGAVYNQVSDKDSWGTAAAKLLAGQLTQTLPAVGTLAQSILQHRDLKVNSPALSVVDILKQQGIDIERALGIGHKPVSDKWIKHAMMTTAVLMGLPAGVQGGNIGQFIWDWEHHDQQPKTLGEFINGLLYGNIKGQNAK